MTIRHTSLCGLLGVAITLGFVFVYPMGSFSQVTEMPSQVSAEVSTTAQQALSNYVQNVVNAQNATRLGFRSYDEAKRARLGQPVPEMIIGLSALKQYKPGSGAASTLTDAKTVWFPVLVDDQTRAKVEITQKNNRWVPGEFGGAKTAQLTAQALNNLPKLLESKHITAPYKVTLVRVPVLLAQFLYVSGATGEFLVPAMAQPQRFNLENSGIYPADEVLSRLRDFAKDIDEKKVM